MEVPPAENPAWADILTGRMRFQLDFVAAKILLGWLMLKVRSDPSADMVSGCARTLQHLFAQNAQLPCVQHDLAQIFGVATRLESGEEASDERMPAPPRGGEHED